jgi:hypothetical protein
MAKRKPVVVENYLLRCGYRTVPASHLLAESLRRLGPEFRKQLAHRISTTMAKKTGKKADKAAVRAAVKERKRVARFDKRIAKIDKRLAKLMDKKTKLEAKRDVGKGGGAELKKNGKKNGKK